MIPNIAVAKLHQSHSEDEQKTKMSRKTGEKTDMAISLTVPPTQTKTNAPWQVHTAVIMAGGKGRRLQPLTDEMPKPLVPIAGESVLTHILRLLQRCGIRRAFLTLQYRGAQIRKKYGSHFGEMQLEYVEEPVPMGTAGGVKHALESAGVTTQTVLVISGDAVCEMDLCAVMRLHAQRMAHGTLVVTDMKDPTGFGVVTTDREDRITGFIEKPPRAVWENMPVRYVNTGIYVLSPALLRRIPDHIAFDFGRELFPLALQEGYRLFAAKSHGYWCDIGTPASFYRCNFDAAAGKIFPVHTNAFCAQHSIAGENCNISEQAEVRRCVLMEGVTVEKGARLAHAILCDNVRVGKDVTVGHGAVIGPGVILQDGIVVPPGAVYS